MTNRLVLPRPKAVLFDLDGTLVESSLDFNFLRSQFGLDKGQDLLTHIASLAPAERKQAEELVHKHEIEDAHSAKILPGAARLLAGLQAAAMPVGIITRNCRSAANIKLANNGIDVPFLICREDSKPKPDPEALLNMASHWQLPTHHCWYIGDYLYDLQAANRAGMVAALYTGSHYHKSTYEDFVTLADVVIEDFNTLSNTWSLS